MIQSSGYIIPWFFSLCSSVLIYGLLIQKLFLVQVSLDKLEWETLHRHSRTNVFQLTIAAARPMPCAAADIRMIFPSSRPMVLTCAGTARHRNLTKVSQHHPWESDANTFPKLDMIQGVHLPSQLSSFAAVWPSVIQGSEGQGCLKLGVFFSYTYGPQAYRRHLSSEVKLLCKRNWIFFFNRQKKMKLQDSSL